MKRNSTQFSQLLLLDLAFGWEMRDRGRLNFHPHRSPSESVPPGKTHFSLVYYPTCLLYYLPLVTWCCRTTNHEIKWQTSTGIYCSHIWGVELSISDDLGWVCSFSWELWGSLCWNDRAIWLLGWVRYLFFTVMGEDKSKQNHTSTFHPLLASIPLISHWS